MPPVISGRRMWIAAAAVTASACLAAAVTTSAAAAPAAYSPPPTYQANDYGGGQVMSIPPPGENGLVNAAQLAQFETTGARPPASNDQTGKYANLLYGYPTLTNAGLSSYYDDESFGVHPGDIARTEYPSPDQPVVIYRDAHDVPHVYGQTDAAMAFGAGYAQAEDRLFLMDVLRHYGEGTLSAFLGPSCGDEQMDPRRAAARPLHAAAGPGPGRQPATGVRRAGAARQGRDLLVRRRRQGLHRPDRDRSSKLPADYGAALEPPQPWTVADVVYVASLIGGIFGGVGGTQAFTDFKEQNDPDAPTTISTSFPYEIPGTINPSLTAMPDNAAAPLSDGPTDTTAGCNGVPTNSAVLSIIASLLAMPKHMSNALVVGAQHSATGHPLAVFGPQVSYFAPEILIEEDLRGPDYAAEGASFPGTGLVELGRGEDYAWSATSAGTDLTDQRLELICNPSGRAPQPQGTYYEYDGQCLPMTHETFTETAVTKPGGTGAPTVINHDLYLTRHGIVQGWTTADGGKPVAVVNQRSTYGHEVDSAVGFLRWANPALTHDAQSWMTGPSEINYTFNWFYADDTDIAYFNSGLDPIRPSGVDPNLPTWGTGDAEWQGFLPASGHPQAIDPASGIITSWNNKPAPQFSASDSQYGYGPVYRVQMLSTQIANQLAAHGGKITHANLVQAMETAASQDLDGLTTLPELLPYLAGRSEPAGVQQMLATL